MQAPDDDAITVALPGFGPHALLFTENFKSGCRFTFHIYGCTENGHELLEIQTGYTEELRECGSRRSRLLPASALCEIGLFPPQNSNSEFVAAPSLVNFTSESSSVTLEWRYDQDDLDHPAFITGYLVTVQEARQDTLAGGAMAWLWLGHRTLRH